MEKLRTETLCIQAGYKPGNGEPRQIPIVQSICESGDKGTPVALDSDTVTGRAFLQLAAAVVRQVDKRNIEMEPTRIVQVKK